MGSRQGLDGTQFAVASTLRSRPARSQTNTATKLCHLHFREDDFIPFVLKIISSRFLFVAVFIQSLIHKCSELNKSYIKISVDV